MNETVFIPVHGVIQNINQMADQCCQQLVTLRTANGTVNFVVTPDTYVVDNERLRTGMHVTGFYDGDAPVPLIFPPQYRAVVMAPMRAQEEVTLDYFDHQLNARNQSLQLNLGAGTTVTTSNGQRFSCNLENRLLLVFYSRTTRSMPPQTTPERIIVMC